MNGGENREKNLPPPTKGGRSGNCRGSNNQKTGKCHELSTKSIKFVVYPSHPGGFRGGGGVGGQNFKSPVNFMNCRENQYKKKKPTKGEVRSGNFRGSKNQKSGKCNELQRKVINKN